MSDTTVNRSYKDSLFRMIFREKKELLSLYNAINGTHYEDPEQLRSIFRLRQEIQQERQCKPADRIQDQRIEQQ